MKIGAVFFDAGETLLAPHPSFAEIFAGVTGDFGHPLQADQVRRAFESIAPTFAEVIDSLGIANWSTSQDASRSFWSKIYDLAFARLGIRDPEGELAAAMYERFTRYESYRLFDDAVPTLESIRQERLTVGLISNFEGWLEGMLIEMEVAHLFDVMIISGREGIEKPDPRIFKLALERSGHLAEESMYVGDHPVIDVEGAEAVGMRGVLVDRRGRYSDHRGPRVSSLMELLPMIFG